MCLRVQLRYFVCRIDDFLLWTDSSNEQQFRKRWWCSFFIECLAKFLSIENETFSREIILAGNEIIFKILPKEEWIVFYHRESLFYFLESESQVHRSCVVWETELKSWWIHSCLLRSKAFWSFRLFPHLFLRLKESSSTPASASSGQWIFRSWISNVFFLLNCSEILRKAISLTLYRYDIASHEYNYGWIQRYNYRCYYDLKHKLSCSILSLNIFLLCVRVDFKEDPRSGITRGEGRTRWHQIFIFYDVYRFWSKHW